MFFSKKKEAPAKVEQAVAATPVMDPAVVEQQNPSILKKKRKEIWNMK